MGIPLPLRQRIVGLFMVALASSCDRAEHVPGGVSDVVINICDAPASVQQLGWSVCAVVDSAALTRVAGGWQLIPIADADWHEDRIAGIRATGFLVRRNMVATTAHSGVASDVSRLALVFGFRLDRDRDRVGTFLRSDQVRTGLSRVWGDNDIVLIAFGDTLEQRPLDLGGGDIIEHNQIFVIGHPDGLPLKYHGEGDVKCSQRNCMFFYTAHLMFPYNSGSPALTAAGRNAVVVGVHQSASYVYDDTTCNCGTPRTGFIRITELKKQLDRLPKEL